MLSASSLRLHCLDCALHVVLCLEGIHHGISNRMQGDCQSIRMHSTTADPHLSVSGSTLLGIPGTFGSVTE